MDGLEACTTDGVAALSASPVNANTRSFFMFRVQSNDPPGSGVALGFVLNRVEHQERETNACRDLRGGRPSGKNPKSIKRALAVRVPMHLSCHDDHWDHAK